MEAGSFILVHHRSNWPYHQQVLPDPHQDSSQHSSMISIVYSSFICRKTILLSKGIYFDILKKLKKVKGLLSAQFTLSGNE